MKVHDVFQIIHFEANLYAEFSSLWFRQLEVIYS